MIDSNYNNTEVLADLPEEQASQPIVKVVAARSKAKAKPQRREPVDLPSIIPMNERKWIYIEPGDFSLRVRDFEDSNPSSSTFSTSTTRKMERFNSGELKNIFRVNSHRFFIGLTIDGKHVWKQEDEQKGDFSITLMIQEKSFISELFKDIQDAILLIFHYRTKR